MSLNIYIPLALYVRRGTWDILVYEAPKFYQIDLANINWLMSL
jgi:hypothetical protein